MEMHGLAGQARHYDILVKQTQKPALSALIRIEKDDLQMFTMSLAGFSFSVAEYLGREYDVNGSVAIIDHGPYLGLLADAKLVNA